MKRFTMIQLKTAFTMKKIILLFSTIFLLNQAWAQDSCTPAMNLPDTLIGVIPLPFDSMLNPEGGIQTPACINEPFEFTLTVVTPASISIAGAPPVPLNSIDFDPETAISNLPDGLDYVCNPPTCIFEKDSTGCVSIFGTITDEAFIGVHDLVIAGIVRTAFGAINLTFPNAAIFPGNYFLTVQAEGTCVSSTDEIFAENFSILNRPNPFQDYTDIEIYSQVSGDFEFRVYDVIGKQLHRQEIALIEGQNIVPFDGSNLANGIYVYSISDGQFQVTKKMIVNR